MGRRAVISVLVPVYNLENRIEACLAALQASRFPDFEVLCLDDGSTDATPALLDAAAARDPRFRVFHLPHRGVSAARNFGLDHAVGDYLTFVDGDDQLHCCFLGALLDAARRTGAAVTIARHLEGTDPGPGSFCQPGFRSLAPQELLRDIEKIYVHGKLYTRRAVASCRFAAGLAYGEDVVFVLDVLAGVCQRGEGLAYTDTPLYFYTQRSDSASRTAPPEARPALLSVLRDRAAAAPTPALRRLYLEECCKYAGRFALQLRHQKPLRRRCLQALDASAAELRQLPGQTHRTWLRFAAECLLVRVPPLHRLGQWLRDACKTRDGL